jgi:hypothetical protein
MLTLVRVFMLLNHMLYTSISKIVIIYILASPKITYSFNTNNTHIQSLGVMSKGPQWLGRKAKISQKNDQYDVSLAWFINRSCESERFWISQQSTS